MEDQKSAEHVFTGKWTNILETRKIKINLTLEIKKGNLLTDINDICERW